MYTAIFHSKEKVNGKTQIVITISNGKDSFQENIGTHTSMDSISHTVRVILDRLNKADEIYSQIEIGAPVPLEIKEETPEETAKRKEQEFNDKVAEAYWKYEKELITKEEYNTIVTNLKTEFSEGK
jgi:hypothetical protein